jgi:hypothetical protein
MSILAKALRQFLQKHIRTWRLWLSRSRRRGRGDVVELRE